MTISKHIKDIKTINKVQYIISEKCNMNCIYCNVNKSSDQYLSIDDFITFKEEVLDKLEYYQLDIFGGEPLLFAEIVLEIVKLLQNDNRCNIIMIPTNGSIYNEVVKEILSYDKVYCSISNDGINQIKNRSKLKIYYKEFNVNRVHLMIGGSDLSKDYNIIIKQHNYFKKLNISCDMTLLRDQNSFSIEQAKLFLENYKEFVDTLDFNHILLPKIVTHYLFRFLDNVIYGYINPGCQLGEKYVSFSNNHLISCTRFSRTDDEDKLEYINDYLKECDTCSIREFCGQGCRYEIIQNDGVIEELCTIYKGIYKILQSKITTNLIKEYKEYKRKLDDK